MAQEDVVTPVKKPVSRDTILAAQVNQLREQNSALRKQILDQSKLIVQFQSQLAAFEEQRVSLDNEKFRLEHGLKPGQQFIQENGEWFVIDQPGK